jgi:uncharacterized protein involved in propanediol utilization
MSTAAKARLIPAAGQGYAGSHHGEILQGSWRWPTPDGARAIACLVTLPLSHPGSVAHFTPESRPPITIHPEWKLKAGRAARLTLDALGDRSSGGTLALECGVPEGLGLGSSTSDVLATIRAVCAARGTQLGPGAIARLAVAAELACDPIMYDGTILFAQREGRVLEHWGQWMPRYLLLSIDTDPARGGVDTLSVPPPHDQALDEYDGLIARARTAFRMRDPVAIAGVATRSAELNQRILPMRGFEALQSLTATQGCLGLQISHSGTVAGLLFDPATRPQVLEALLPRVCAEGMAPLGMLAAGAAEEVRSASLPVLE